MNIYRDFWNGEENTPNLLGITNPQTLYIIEDEKAEIAEEKFTSEITDNTIFNLEYIKEIHDFLFRNLYECAGRYRTTQFTRDTNHPAPYLVNDYMHLYDKMILKKCENHYSSIRELAEYIAQVYSNLLFIDPFLTGNVKVASIFVNLILHKKHVRKIDFSQMSLISDSTYRKALNESIGYDYSQMAEIIRILM